MRFFSVGSFTEPAHHHRNLRLFAERRDANKRRCRADRWRAFNVSLKSAADGLNVTDGNIAHEGPKKALKTIALPKAGRGFRNRASQ